MSNIVSQESFSSQQRFSSQSSLFFLVGLLVALGLVTAPLSSLAEEKDEPKRKLQKSGTLASARGGSGYEGVAVGVWGQDDVDLYTEESPPITGSVSRLNKREWIIKVFNNSEDRYSISLRVDEMNKAGKKIDDSTYSALLAGGKSWERKFNAREYTQQAELQLTSWKNLDAEKRKKEKAKEKAAEEAKKKKGK